MSKTLRNMSLAALFAVSASAFIPGQAFALSMAECSAQYKAAKAAGTAGGMKWNDFRKAQCSAAAAPAVTAPPAAAAASRQATPSGSFMSNCSTSWKAMKASNSVPAGMKFKDFVASKCQVSGAPATAATAAGAPAAAAAGKKASAAPPEPSVTPDTTPLATTDKNGKAFTPGQMAAHQRMRSCGEQWRNLKAQGKTPVGMAWPQYWSNCNKQLKSQGQ